MDESRFQVKILHETHQRHWLYAPEQEVRLQKLLSAAYATAQATQRRQQVAWCLCRAGEDLVLSVKRSPEGRYYLARMPHQGPLHASACDHAGGTTEGLAQLYTTAAVREGVDGLQIAVQAPTSVQAGIAPPATSPTARDAQRSNKRAALTLLGVLHLFWEKSRLNQWEPNGRELHKRSSSQVARALQSACEDVQINQVDAADLVFVARNFTIPGEPPAGPSRASQTETLSARFARMWQSKRAPGHAPVVWVVGELLSARQAGKSWVVCIKGLSAPSEPPTQAAAHLTPLWDNLGVVAQWMESFPAQWNRFTQRRVALQAGNPTDGGRLIALLAVRNVTAASTGKESFEFIAGALMETGKSFIPVDSSYEMLVAHRLVVGARSFIKPVRYDASEDTFPDFVLTDTAPRVPMEVFGFSGEQYMQRAAQKIAHYSKTGSPAWVWWANQGQPLPGFPQVAVHSTNHINQGKVNV